MPYAHELKAGQVIRQHRTGTLMHIEHIDVYDVQDQGMTLPTATITGHGCHTGDPLSSTHSANVFIVEEVPAGSIVAYHGSMTDHHDLYRVAGRCTCPACDHETNRHRPTYQLTSQRRNAQIQHVRRASLTIIRAACDHCPTTADLPAPTLTI
ncbi:MAG: hypothetical protein JXA67_10765 [Micromonosporaceae bacterium]|nr:hypothetical protein [Micromonosporaceae bacterium]